MPTPKPPYPAAFRQQLVELVRAGRGVGTLASMVRRNCRNSLLWCLRCISPMTWAEAISRAANSVVVSWRSQL
jgi:hypothetical protein